MKGLHQFKYGSHGCCVFVACLSALLTPSIAAGSEAPGSLDTTFTPVLVKNADETSRQPLDIHHVKCVDIAVGPGNKIVAIGDFDEVDGVPRRQIMRLNADGTLDMGFEARVDVEIRALACQSDGKILLGIESGPPGQKLIRLNPDGSVDAQFQGNLPYFGEVTVLALQGDGRILAAGTLSTADGGTEGRTPVVRFTSSGVVDPSFNCFADSMGQAANIRCEISAMQVLTEGKLLVLGYFWHVNDTIKGRVARLLPNGALDPSFSRLEDRVGGPMNGLAVDSAGGVFVGGSFRWPLRIVRPDLVDPVWGGPLVQNVGSRTNLLHLGSDGSYDLAFNAQQTLWDGFDYASVERIARQGDGRLLLAGYNASQFPSTWYERHHWLGRLTSSGQLDPRFRPLIGITDQIHAVLPLPDGKILLAGEFLAVEGGSYGVVRLNSDGQHDTSFHAPRTRSPEPGVIRAILEQPDGKLVIGGAFTHVQGAKRRNLARLNANGTLDASFAPEAVPTIKSLALDSEGGLAATWDNVLDARPDLGSYVFRVLPNGTVDAQYAATIESRNHYRPLNVWSDRSGRILVEGQFGTVPGGTGGGLVRLRPDGTVDQTFAPDPSVVFHETGTTALAWTLAFSSDGRILVALSGTEPVGRRQTDFNRLLRLNPDGSRDRSFVESEGFVKTGESAAGIFAPLVSTLPDNRFVVCGNYDALTSGGQLHAGLNTAVFSGNGVFQKGLTVLSTPRVVANNSIWAIAEDGKLVRQSVDDPNAPALDPLFLRGAPIMYGQGFAFQAEGVYLMGAQRDGKILAAGANLTVNNNPAGELIRFHGEPPPAITVPRFLGVPQLRSEGIVFSVSGSPGSILALESSVDFTNWVWRASITNLPGPSTVHELTALAQAENVDRAETFYRLVQFPNSETAPQPLVGRLIQTVSWPLAPDVYTNLAASHKPEAEALGLTFDDQARALWFKEKPLAGHWVAIGAERVMADGAGVFRLTPPVGAQFAQVLAEASDDPHLAEATFEVSRLGSEGAAPSDIRVHWEISPEVGMNDPQEQPIRQKLSVVSPDEVSDPTCGTDNRTRCCLDYDGPFGTGVRNAVRPFKAINYFESTCFKQVQAGICTREYNSHIKDLQTPRLVCYENHKYRNCQNIDGTFSLACSKTSLTSGETAELSIWNNTFANETTLSPSAGTVQGRLLLLRPVGGRPIYTVAHYDNSVSPPTHLEARVLTFQAPAADKFPPGTDEVSVEIIALAAGETKVVHVTVRKAKQPVPSFDTVTFGNGLFVATSRSDGPTPHSSIYTSADGVTWSLAKGLPGALYGIRYVNDRFVAVGGNGLILESPDGQLWGDVSSPGSAAHLSDVAYGLSQYVAVGGELDITSHNTTRILSSPDARVWQDALSEPGAHVSSICSGNSLFAAVGSAGQVWVSGNGQTWKKFFIETQPGEGGALAQVAFGNNHFVAVANPPAIVASSDGYSWRNVWIGPNSAALLRGIAYANGLFVAVGWRGTILTSPTGLTWTNRSVGSNALESIAHGNGTFVAVGSSGILTSLDGVQWVPR